MVQTQAQMAHKTDVDIHDDVARELAWDTRITPNEIGIQVSHGVVTLTGAVDSWAEVCAAQAAVHRVAGVLDLANDLTVKHAGSGERSDTEIAQAVRQALEWDVMVPDRQIQSTVSRGEVTLEGTVPFWSQRADATRAIERLTGVKRVVNRIEVKPTEQVSLEGVRYAVERALDRHAEREAGRIQLRVADGEVTVQGAVQSLGEKQAVLGAVRGSRGVRAVVDELRVEGVR